MGHLVMSDKERQRKAWMLMVCEGKITLGKAREALGVSYRQAKRIYRCYMTQGDEGLVHHDRNFQILCRTCNLKKSASISA